MHIKLLQMFEIHMLIYIVYEINICEFVVHTKNTYTSSPLSFLENTNKIASVIHSYRSGVKKNLPHSDPSF